MNESTSKLTPLHRALLRGERDLVVELSSVLRTNARATAELIEVSVHRSDALIAGALSRYVTYVEDETERVIFNGSVKTRSRAHAALLAMLGMGERRPFLPPRVDTDRAAARMAAKSLAAVVGGTAVAFLFAGRRGADVPRELRKGPGLAKGKVDSIAATESARAVADEARVVASLFPESQIVFEWSSVLDRRRCPTCAALDGERVKQGALFPGNIWPPAHPRCRCVPIPIIVPLRKAA